MYVSSLKKNFKQYNILSEISFEKMFPQETFINILDTRIIRVKENSSLLVKATAILEKRRCIWSLMSTNQKIFLEKPEVAPYAI